MTQIKYREIKWTVEINGTQVNGTSVVSEAELAWQEHFMDNFCVNDQIIDDVCDAIDVRSYVIVPGYVPAPWLPHEKTKKEKEEAVAP